MSLPTLTDLKAHNNMMSSADDAELQRMLDAAVDVVEGLVGPINEPMTVTETHYNVASSVLILRRMPVVEVLSIGSRSYGAVSPLTVEDFDLDSETGLLRVANGGRFYGTYTVSYTAGRADLPAAIHLAVLIIAAHLWETQRMPGQSPDSAPAGFGGLDGIPDTGAAGMGFAIPRRAEELLRSYMRPVIA